MDMDISMDIHRKSVDMDINMDGKFHIHGNPEFIALPGIFIYVLFRAGQMTKML